MDKYDTKLSPSDEAAYQKWIRTLREGLQSTDDYDMRGAFKDDMKAAANGHMGDKYKKPNHPTFSDGSVYSNPQTPGGTWNQAPDGSWSFWATQHNVDNLGITQLLNYFNTREQGNNVILPGNYKLPAGRK